MIAMEVDTTLRRSLRAVAFRTVVLSRRALDVKHFDDSRYF